MSREEDASIDSTDLNKGSGQSGDPQNLRSLSQAHKDLSKIREIIHAKAFTTAKAEHLESLRKNVAQIFTESLNDRQTKDQSVRQVLVPLVEDAVEESVKSKRHEMADYLFPLIGEMVRKFCLAFIRDFIEKTNELIENSLTPKSILWRFKAWRSGVSYSTYIASQVYSFQIHQVLLIHKETGALLNSQSAKGSLDKNADLVSAMLTAINDFASDSYGKQQLSTHAKANGKELQKEHKIEYQDTLGLHEIKTDEFTIYIRQGPQALIVTAVTGNLSPSASYKLQSVLEKIHAMYLPQLQQFAGDTSPFKSASIMLRECLIDAEIEPDKAIPKPLYAIIILAFIVWGLVYYAALSWQSNSLSNSLYELPTDQGIVINSNKVLGLKEIELRLLRDPDAISVEQWLAKHPDKNIDISWLRILETSYASLAPDLVLKRISAQVEKFNRHLLKLSKEPIVFDALSKTLSGTLDNTNFYLLESMIDQVIGIQSIDIINKIKIGDVQLNERLAKNQALSVLKGELAQLQLQFASGSALLEASFNKNIELVYTKFKQVKTLSQSIDKSATLLILGASDNVGSEEQNRVLSAQRAKSVSDALLALGLDEQDVMSSGLGIIEDAPEALNVRTVFFHVILNEK